MTSMFPGAFNARDVGGLPLVGGGTVRAGVLLRSDALATLTDEGVALLERVGCVVDLRTPQERAAAPNRLPSSGEIRVLERPLLEGAIAQMAEGSVAAMAQLSEQAGSSPEPSAELLEELRAQIPTLAALYTSMLAHGAAVFADCARTVAAPGASGSPHGAVLLHCTAGKDRTGIAIALLLAAAGVEREAIIADYTRSQSELTGPWADRMLEGMRRAGIPPLPEIEQLMVSTPASAIEAALAEVDARGGAAAYLRSGGLSEEELALLRSRLRDNT
ncbi:tyrosine-protein phosphatase [Brachybacterium sp. AOP35-5H-19]|uniref:tyrosine-protein phosphatase n=1 Tax=Brachybacterium sp. AOP35-5H-19 TaxID=3457685 RepID=UPI004033B999